MKVYLWTAARLLAVLGGLLLGTEVVHAASPSEIEAQKQEVWEMQIKYSSYACAGIVCAAIAYWALSNTNQRKKKYIEDLKKQERLDANEGMPLS